MFLWLETPNDVGGAKGREEKREKKIEVFGGLFQLLGVVSVGFS